MRGSGGIRTPSARGEVVIYSHVQPTVSASDPNELGANGGSRVSRTPCRSRHALCSKQAHASRDSASRTSQRKEEDLHLTPPRGAHSAFETGPRPCSVFLPAEERGLAPRTRVRVSSVFKTVSSTCSIAPPSGRRRSRPSHSPMACASPSKRAPSPMDSPSISTVESREGIKPSHAELQTALLVRDSARDVAPSFQRTRMRRAHESLHRRYRQ
jgi:hypothetical protein